MDLTYDSRRIRVHCDWKAQQQETAMVAGAESRELTPLNMRPKKRVIEMGEGFKLLKLHPHPTTYFLQQARASPLPLLTVLLTREQVFKCLKLWETFLILTIAQ